MMKRRFNGNTKVRFTTMQRGDESFGRMGGSMIASIEKKKVRANQKLS